MNTIILAIIAVAVGSFLNLVIYRLPKIIQHTYETECAVLLKQPPPKPLHLSLWWPRSFCPACHKTLSWLSNIPLLSFILQKGQCRHCHAKIAWQYPVVELMTLVLFLYAAYQFEFSLKLIFALGFIGFLLPLLVIDYQTRLLPDSLTLGLLWLGLIANTQQYFALLSDAVLGAVGGYLTLWILIQVFYLMTGRWGMGGGDLKLFAALGAWFGWLLMPIILFFASITGVIGGLIYLKVTRQTRNTPIPFGPFLCIIGLCTLFFGQNILAWYLP